MERQKREADDEPTILHDGCTRKKTWSVGEAAATKPRPKQQKGNDRKTVNPKAGTDNCAHNDIAQSATLATTLYVSSNRSADAWERPF
eukprot:2206659-Amphidinium_carterae.1